ncbi:hypothetical protein D3C75_1056580 [compost metagenome]
MFFLESRIGRPSLEEVLKCDLLVPQRLLQGHARNVAKKCQVWIFLDRGEPGACCDIANFNLFLVERIGSPAQYRVIDKAHAAERLRQELNLLWRRIEAVFVGAMRFHVSHSSQNYVRALT